MKKILALVLTVILLCSVMIVPVSAETVIGGDKRLHTLEDAISYWEQQLGYEIPTKTYYFYFPDSWKFEANEYYDASVGLDSCLPSIYWYGESTANPDEYQPYIYANFSGYPGYMLTNEVAPNIYKAEIPADVKILVFSNGVCEDKAGDRWCEGWQFNRQVGDTETCYSESDWYGFYPNGLETVENMILVPDQNSSAETSWRPDMFAGSWFYYYGDGKYGYNPTLEEAGEKVYSNGEFPRLNSDSKPSETVPSEPAPDNTEPTEPSTPESDVTVETEKFKAGEQVNPFNITNPDDEAVTFTAKTPEVATVDDEGVVTALQKGKAEFVVTVGEKEFGFKVRVTSNPELEKKTITVKKNKVKKVKLTGKVKDIKNTYKNTKKAEIISGKNATNLKIKGLKKGTTTLKIKVNGVKTLKLKVTVK